MQAGTLYPFFSHPISSTELLVAGAVLLAIAAVMLAFGRRQKIALQPSPVTEELALHLSRIADVLERLAMRPAPPVYSEPPKRSADTAPQKVAEDPGRVAYSMFGR